MPRPPDAILALRRQLAAAIDRALGPGAQHALSRAYGIPQPRMSELSRGVVDRCTVEWLIRRVDRMGGSVTLSIQLGDVGRAWHRERFERMRARRRQAANVATKVATNVATTATNLDMPARRRHSKFGMTRPARGMVPRNMVPRETVPRETVPRNIGPHRPRSRSHSRPSVHDHRPEPLRGHLRRRLFNAQLSPGISVDDRSLFTDFWTNESKTTEKVLSRIPEGSDYKPDPKSRTAQEIAWQIVCEEKMLIDMLENGKAEWTPAPTPSSMKEVTDAYSQQSTDIIRRLGALPDDCWGGTLEFFGSQRPASPTAWSFLFDIVHHRGQISTYLRPMGSTVPQIYGPSGDEP